MAQVEFGFYPDSFIYSGDKINITTLPDLNSKVDYVSSLTSVHNGWIYAPRLEFVSGGDVTQLPYTKRYFEMPMTHTIEHQDDDPHRLWFLVWVLGFLTGMKIMPEGQRFLDSTPLKSGALSDFYAGRKELEIGLECADALWDKHGSDNKGLRSLEGAIHALWLAQRPQLLSFERFNFAYLAIDACWAACNKLVGLKAPQSHPERINAIKNHFSLTIPDWSKLTTVRNSLMHEALVDGLPLGYANIPSSTNQSSLLSNEMCNFVSRVIVGLLEIPAQTYIQSSMISMQRQMLE